MTKIKLCGLSRPCDIEAANELNPDYIGFVFAPGSKRYVTFENAARLKRMLNPGIRSVGVFVNADPAVIAGLLKNGTIDMAQLHGNEDDHDIRRLRALTDRPVIQAFRISSEDDMEKARRSAADYILLDSGAGSGTVFDWKLVENIGRPFFLAGGLDAGNVKKAAAALNPYAVDVSSGIETDGVKDKKKMAAFVAAFRKETDQ